MRKIVLTVVGLLALSALVPVPGCGNSDDTSTPTDTTGGSAGTAAGGEGGEGGTSAGGEGGTSTTGGSGGTSTTGGSGGTSDAGSGGTAAGGEAGAAGAGSTCPPAEFPPISKCDAPDSDCVKCFCDDSGTATDCKAKWEACEQDPACNKAISCFNGCGDDPKAIQACAGFAGTSLPKALALQNCNGAGKVCGMACGN
jgi:hypothetical protein